MTKWVCKKCGDEYPANKHYFPMRKSGLGLKRGTCLGCFNDSPVPVAVKHRDDAKKVKEEKAQKIASSPPRRRGRYPRRTPKFNAKLTALLAQYRARSINALPPWITETELDRMLEIYEEARELSTTTGINHHVDHIEPLCGLDRSGLHVPWNLRVITAKENWQKGISTENNS